MRGSERPKHAGGRWRSITPGALVSALVAAAAILVSAPVQAQVMEISADGAVMVHQSAGDARVLQVNDGVITVRDGSGAVSWANLGQEDDRTGEAAVASVPAIAVTVADAVRAPRQYAVHVERAAAAASISPALLSALVWQESRWNANAVSPKGAIGLTQLMPPTARELGVDPRDPIANLYGGARYLRAMLDAFGGNLEQALAAYNAGPGRVRRAKGIPAIRETQSYVKSIVERLSAMSQGGNQ